MGDSRGCIIIIIAQGFVQWRVAFYVAGEDGSVLNFMSLFDDYLVWKAVF